MRAYWLISIYLLFTSIGHAQEVTLEDVTVTVNETANPAELVTTRAYANEDIKLRKFDEKNWRDVVGNNDFDENQKATTQDRKDGEQSNKTGRRYKEDEPQESGPSPSISIPMGGGLLQALFYIIVLTIIALLLFYVIKNTSIKSNPNLAQVDTSDATASVTDISELDVDSLLNETIASGNYKLAIRIYFLGLLKRLNEIGLIAWKKDKTNRDYLMELFLKQRYYAEVQKLTLAYEQVWYGDHSLPQEIYAQLEHEFKSLNQKLTP